MAIVNVFFRARALGVLIGMLLVTMASSRSTNNNLVKFTEELSTEQTNLPKAVVPYAMTTGSDKNLVFKEFSDIVLKLSAQSDEEMQADQPMNLGANPTRDGKTLDSAGNDPLHEAQKQMRMWEIQKTVLAFTGRAPAPTTTQRSRPSIPEKSREINAPPALEDIPQINLPTFPDSFAFNLKREAIPAICPIVNEDNLTVTFNISESKATSKDMVLNVMSAELKLYKIPFKMVDIDLKDDDDGAVSKLQETFKKSNVSASERAIRTKVQEQRTVLITVYKMRNKRKYNGSDFKKIETITALASYEGIVTLNITRAINVWGHDPRRTLKLVVTVEDEQEKKYPAKNFFLMRCGSDIEKPIPIDNLLPFTEKSSTAWMNLETEERPAAAEAYNAAASTMNRYSNERSRTGAAAGRKN